MYNAFENGTDDFRPTTTDPFFEKPRPRRRVLKTVGKGLLAVLLAAAISVGSIVGYVHFTGANTQPLGKEDNSIVRTVYSSANASALTTPEIYEKCVPSVVAIESVFGQGNYASSAAGSGTGTGIVMTSDGYILTNDHVVSDAASITVTTNDGQRLTATLVGSDPNTDVAVIKVTPQKALVPADFSESDVVAGELAVVIGNPLGITFAETVTQGIISAPSREVTIGKYIMTLIQIDAAVNPGNSGGPLINALGEVVGVVSSKISQSNVEGIGFAIPIDTALRVAEDLMANGRVTDRPMLGITVRSYTKQQAEIYQTEEGIIVQEVTPGSPADIGGVQVGDKIVSFNGTPVSTSAELNFEKEKCRIGDTAKMGIVRNGVSMELTIVLTAAVEAQ